MRDLFNPVITGIYAFNSFCLAVAWFRYHETWGLLREYVHLALIFVFVFLASFALTKILLNRWRRRREAPHED